MNVNAFRSRAKLTTASAPGCGCGTVTSAPRTDGGAVTQQSVQAQQITGIRLQSANVNYDPISPPIPADQSFQMDVLGEFENLEGVEKTVDWVVRVNGNQVGVRTFTIGPFDTIFDSMQISFDAPQDDPNLPSEGTVEVTLDSLEFDSPQLIDTFEVTAVDGGNGTNGGTNGGNGTNGGTNGDGGGGGINRDVAVLGIGLVALVAALAQAG